MGGVCYFKQCDQVASEQKSEGESYVNLSGKSFHAEGTVCARTPKQVCAWYIWGKRGGRYGRRRVARGGILDGL